MKRHCAARRGLAGLLGFFCVVLAAAVWATAAHAQSAVIDLSKAGATAEVIGGFVMVETDKREFPVAKPGSAPGAKDMLVLQARGPGPRFRWILAGIANTGTAGRDMAITIPDQGFAGSGLFWPKPPGSRIVSVLAADPLSLQRLADTGKTVYGLSLDGGKLGAIAFEIIGPPPNSITLWQREAYDEQSGSFAFLRGALLGIAALLAAGMFSLYGLRSRPVFLAAGGFAVAAVAFMAQEAGHFQTLAWALGLKGLSPSVFRAVVESLMAGFLLIYLANTSELRRVMPIVGNFMLAGGMACLLVLVYGFFDPLVAAGVARIAFCIAAVAGFIIVYLLWRRGQTRAETAMLCWSVILAWTFLAFIVLASDPRSVSLSPVLLAGLCTVLVVMAFSLANYAFSHGGMARHFSHEAGRRALALAGARAYVWDWQADEGELHVGEELETALGLNHGAIVEEGADAFIDRIHPADRGSYLVAVEAAEEQGNGLIDRQFRMRHGDGGYRWFHLRGRAMPGPNKRAARCIGTLTDVTSAKLSEERLITDAVHDLVTGLPNRALFIDRLARAIAVADRFRGLTVAVIDIDRFRVVNDVLGHEAGDHLLTVIGRRLSSVIKATDSIARLTGGQFGAFFASETEAQDPVALTDTLRSAFTRAIDVDGQEVYLTACIGLCAHRGDGAPAEQLLADAAIALYEAKRRGHDSFETFRPSMRDERAELALRESELRRAIDRGEFEVHYQPIARLDDMTLAGFEALVRWRHPKLGLLAPESFISLAEQSGMIKEIGRIVLHETARQLGVWQRSFRQSEPIFVAVNISSAQLIEPGLFEDIQNVLRRESVARGSLKIEVTESLVMQSPERARQVLERFKDLGIGIACDDFGTGHSSLSNLRKMPFDTIKIDKSFIAADAEDERAQTILDAIVGMGSSLGLAVVAEGIESQEQIDRLGELGCEFGQGFFIGQPMTARMVSDSLGGLPYATTAVRSVISWLWERAMRSPTPAPAVVDLTAPAEDQRLPDLGIRARPEPRLAPAAFAPAVTVAPSIASPAPPPPVAVEREARPPAGLAPMAPRLARPASEADMQGAKDGKPKRGKRRVRKKRAVKENAPGDAQAAVKPDQA